MFPRLRSKRGRGQDQPHHHRERFNRKWSGFQLLEENDVAHAITLGKL
jgi:hypothetical protein